ncbi:hydrogenase subunit [mine drainage metagenome]|uniref:Hydrogenase subunit n=1 Tax=mine drainage metagenome TaxID=410659 RepID=T1C5X6_9ZZZZ
MPPRGLGWVESPRGEFLVYVQLGADGTLQRVHVRDPSFLTWPAIEYAVRGNVVPDFPLCNKSLNLSYSGYDR